MSAAEFSICRAISRRGSPPAAGAEARSVCPDRERAQLPWLTPRV